MKGQKVKATALFLASLTAALCAAGCAQQSSAEGIPVSLPDYSASPREFLISGGLNTGWISHWETNEKLYIEEQNLFTEEDLRNFADFGNNVLSLGRAAYSLGLDEEWATSKQKQLGDLAYAQGIKRIYISDQAFLQHMEKSYKLLDAEEGIYKTKEELDAFVTSRLQLYINEEWVYGIDLRDEPSYKETDNIGALSASIRRCAAALGKPDLRVHVNLHPHKANVAPSLFAEAGTYETAREAYTKYIEDYIVKMETNQMCVDHYLFRPEGPDWGYYATLQTLRELCTKYDIEMQFYSHSFSQYKNGRQEFRDIGQAELYHNVNSLVGFGVETIRLFSYAPWPSGYGGEKNEFNYDRGYFVDRYGNLNDLWYYGKEIVSQYQSFANIILNYDYKGGKFFRTEEKVSMFEVDQLTTNAIDTLTGTINAWDNSYELTLVKGLEMSNDMMLLTELYDETNDLYLYMVMNPIDPYFDAYGDTTQEVTVDFGTDYEWVAEFDCGQLSYVKLDGGKYTKSLSAGYATYVIPLKTAIQ
ncbi:MAG: hypothetical protein IJW60_03670 [Clostridia bacterium]|nr:hypothetical protein [Clostridia bacterium]